ncbi:hypothetical protein J6590_025711 [Homalodisca vitripennis]|nr:hypothetical protein J6590_025711 [Homalodisca vitripennis]
MLRHREHYILTDKSVRHMPGGMPRDSSDQLGVCNSSGTELARSLQSLQQGETLTDQDGIEDDVKSIAQNVVRQDG